MVANAIQGDAWLHNTDEYHPRLFVIAELADDITLNKSDKHFGCDGKALLAKLESLSPLAELAIIDACERFWRDHSREDTKTALRTVGLVRS